MNKFRLKSYLPVLFGLLLFPMGAIAQFTADYRSIDGTNNNLVHPTWGSTSIQLLRKVPPAYEDGVSVPSGDSTRPNAREISNAVCEQTSDIRSKAKHTDMVWLWGQFVDHDLDLTGSHIPFEDYDIDIPLCDPYFDPYCTGTEFLPFDRSRYDDGPVYEAARQQLNEITAYLDGSVVYGSDEERAKELRTGVNGMLKTSAGNLMPYNEAGLPNAPDNSADFFLGGDVRANENVVLTSMQTLWVREHNRLAKKIILGLTFDPANLDEYVYQRARQLVIAQMQHITYDEWLPVLLGSYYNNLSYKTSTGKRKLGTYQGYDNKLNAGVANVFSTAAYRFGHSMLNHVIERLDGNGDEIPEGHLTLANGFFSPEEVAAVGIEPMLRGAAHQVAQNIDAFIIDDVRNFLFGPPGAGGLDLASLNIQRGRDHGLATFNKVRSAYGLGSVATFEKLTNSDPALTAKLTSVYGTIETLDPWVGILAERPNGFVARNTFMGLTLATIIVDQFGRVRDGDRYWWQRTLSDADYEWVKSQTLKNVIVRNTTINGNEIQNKVFLQNPAISIEP